MFKLDSKENIFVTNKPITSVSEFIEATEAIYKDLGDCHHWYRGVRVGTYNLEPSAVREKTGNTNLDLKLTLYMTSFNVLEVLFLPHMITGVGYLFANIMVFPRGFLIGRRAH
ncbi:hypothetical protein QYZ44_12105 [Vibrio parahaemolyticus]|nr:hypothetical protein [Vibrio parahaemolyticus]MDN4710289.1 hypothetical protein [Vibrio parahaemolyticus]